MRGTLCLTIETHDAGDFALGVMSANPVNSHKVFVSLCGDGTYAMNEEKSY